VSEFAQRARAAWARLSGMLPKDYAEPDAKIIEVYKRRRSFLAWEEHREALVLTDPTRRSADASQCRVAVPSAGAL